MTEGKNRNNGREFPRAKDRHDTLVIQVSERMNEKNTHLDVSW